MTEINNQFYQFMSTYNLKQGIKRFGKEGYEAAMQELRQLNEREVFEDGIIWISMRGFNLTS